MPSISRRAAVVTPLVLPLLLGLSACGGDEPKVSAEVATPATAEAKPPIPEEDAKRFVERFCSAMNSKDNLRLVKMVAPGGEFLVAGQGGPSRPNKMDSASFLRWFQEALSDARTYSVEVRSMTWDGLPDGAVVDAQLREEYGPSGYVVKSDTRIRFFLERDFEGIVRCRRMDGGQ